MNKPIATRLLHGHRVPAYYCAPKRTRQSDTDSTFAKWRQVALDASGPRDLIDDPENATGLAEPHPNAWLGIGLVGLGLGVIASIAFFTP